MLQIPPACLNQTNEEKQSKGIMVRSKLEASVRDDDVKMFFCCDATANSEFVGLLQLCIDGRTKSNIAF